MSEQEQQEPVVENQVRDERGLHTHIKTMMLLYMALQSMYLGAASIAWTATLALDYYPAIAGSIPVLRVIMQVIVAIINATLLTFLVIACEEYRSGRKSGQSTKAGRNAIYNILTSTVLASFIYYIIFYVVPNSSGAALGWYWATGFIGHISVHGFLTIGSPSAQESKEEPMARTVAPSVFNAAFLILMVVVYGHDIWMKFH